MFWFRAIMFLVAAVFIGIGGKFLLKRREAWGAVKKRNATATVAAAIFGLTGTGFAIFSIAELVYHNPNEWLGFKLCFYVLVWMLVFFATAYDAYDDDPPLGPALVVAILGFVSIVYGALYDNPTERVEREVVNVTYLAAANDAYEIRGAGAMGLLGGTFSIAENGVYRYYYVAENGMKKQDSVDASKTYIDDTLTEGRPYLEELRAYTIVYGTKERETIVIRYQDETTWYELHVPAGSVVEAYNFDLN